MDWIESLVLGVVQGLTEFLPISSDGHLTIVQHAFAAWTGRTRSPETMLFFFVMLHVGTLVAIVVHYRFVVADAVRVLLGADLPPPAPTRPTVIRAGVLAVIATLPLIPDKLFFMKWIKLAFDNDTATGAGFLITAAVLLFNTRLKGGAKGLGETTWLDALLIGIAQAFAPLPGVSRSGLTIAAALALGLSRAWAVGFSLLLAVLAISGATLFDLADVDPAILTGDYVARIVASATVAGVIGYMAIIWLVRLVQAGRLWYFSVYLVVLGIGLIVMDAQRKGGTDAGPSHAVDRPMRDGPPHLGDREGGARALQPVAGPVALVPRSGVAGPGEGGEGGRLEPSGLVLGRRVAGDGGGPR